MNELTLENLQILNEKDFTMVDFWQETCPECIALKQEIEEIEKNYTNISFFSVDCKKERKLALKFKVFSLPTVLFISKENVLAKLQRENCTVNEIKKILNEKN